MQAAAKLIKAEPVESDVWVHYQLIRPDQGTKVERKFK